MFALFPLSLLLSRFSTARGGCAHAYYYPTDVCISSSSGGDDYDTDYYDDNGPGSWKITCADTASQPEVLFYNTDDCAGDPDLEQTANLTNSADFCNGENSCTCQHDDSTCEIFELDVEIVCSEEEYEAMSGWRRRLADVDDDLASDEYPDGTAAWFKSTQAVVLDECIGWTYGDIGILYGMWQCNDDFDATDNDAWAFTADNDNDDERMPIQLSLYNDSACTMLFSGWDDYYNYNYNYNEYNDSYWNDCDYDETADCSYQEASGDSSSCSHFLHYPVGMCGNEYDDRYSGGWGSDYGWDDTYSSYTSYNRRRLGNWDYSESSQFTCTLDSAGNIVYEHLSYNSDDCSGTAFATDDVTEYCDATNKCSCNAASAGAAGDSLDCNIASQTQSQTCGDGNNGNSYTRVSLYVTDVCLDSGKYGCYTDEAYDNYQAANSYISKRDYYDTTCTNPLYSECNTEVTVTCDMYGAPSDTSMCGYVDESWNDKEPLDTCIASGWTSTWGSGYAESYMYSCDNGSYSKTTWEDIECGVGGASQPYTSSYDWECQFSADCYCGDATQCKVAQVETLRTCDGDDDSWDYELKHVFEDECSMETSSYYGKYEMATCANGVLDQALYEDANCTDIREECVSGHALNRDEYTSSCNVEAGADDTTCGYFNNEPLDECVSKTSSLYYTSSLTVSCDAHGTFWKQYYDDSNCGVSSSEPQNVTSSCWTSWDGSSSCKCVVDSVCSSAITTYYEPCSESWSQYSSVVGICEYDEYWDSYNMEECVEGQGMYGYDYEDAQCTVEATNKYDDRYYSGGGSFDPTMCSHTISFSAELCQLDTIVEGEGAESDEINQDSDSSFEVESIRTAVLCAITLCFLMR